MLPDTVKIVPPVFDALAAYGIGGLAALVALAWVRLFARGDRWRSPRLLAIVLVLLGGSALAATSGWLARFDRQPPPMAILIAGVFLLPIVAGISPFGRSAAAELSVVSLVGFQSFRLPLELLMHHAAERGIMPVQLSYGGYNYDIVTGATALLLFVLLRRGVRVPRAAIWAWNLGGLLCLGAIAAIAIATSPMVRAFGDQPANVNTWVLFFPYVWLPVGLVTAALLGHIVLTRRLLSNAP
jgi:cytochrome bd-type quinol oxidase subunit 1